MTFEESELQREEQEREISINGIICRDGNRRKVAMIISMPTNHEHHKQFKNEIFVNRKTPIEAKEITGATDFKPYIVFDKLNESDILLFAERTNNYWNF